ncbi:redox-sensitive transcriptional activator SoxR [Streptomyces sp. NPDC006012]|uniref:redox-sensitive transcriptional activator SoxR n=1 Tax=Streptomyces sp. NPDC006012 TaxID=3364739 RepID=UPI003695CCEE
MTGNGSHPRGLTLPVVLAGVVLVAMSMRNGSNQRLYPRHMLRRISLIVVARRLGIPLSDVAAVFITLPGDRAPAQQDWQRVSLAWKRQLEERRRAIENPEHELTGCIGCGCLSMKACLLLNPDDALGPQGPGPVRLQDGGSVRPHRR